MLLNITVMDHLVVLLLSILVLLSTFYGYTVEQKIFQLKNDILKHEKEIKEVKEVKVDLESTKKELAQVKVELESTKKELKEMEIVLKSTKLDLILDHVQLESTKKEVYQVQVELKSSGNALNYVKVELNATKEQMNKHRTEVIEKDNARRKEISQIRADVIALLEEINKIKKELHTQRPGFYVTLTSNPTLSPSQRIEFDKIITDVGNNYDKISAVFTAPKDGLYHFSFTMFSSTGALHAEIMQNNQVRGRNYGTSSGVSATINVVISCKKGDSVFVRHETGRGVENIYGYGYTAFSGFLIY